MHEDVIRSARRRIRAVALTGVSLLAVTVSGLVLPVAVLVFGAFGLAGAAWGVGTTMLIWAIGVSGGTGALAATGVYAWSLVAACVAVFALTAFFRYSRQGIALRAAADDQQAAMSMGIRISWTFALSWGLSASVAAAGGILLDPCE